MQDTVGGGTKEGVIDFSLRERISEKASLR